MIEKVKELWDKHMRRYKNVVQPQNSNEMKFINKFERLGMEADRISDDESAENTYRTNKIDIEIRTRKCWLAAVFRSIVYSCKHIFNYIEKEPAYDNCMRG